MGSAIQTIGLIYRLQIYITMESTVPLLNPEQIEEVNHMILGISEENKKKLDELLAEIVEIENTSILNLYNLVVNEWMKKQKIIDNLCHFSLTMLASIHLLWQQKQEKEERLSTAQIVIDNLQRHIDELGNENQKFKVKINEAETHIESISGEKQRFEELYKSQSCCNFVDQPYHSVVQVPCHVNKQCQACGEHKSLLQKQKDQFLKQSSELREQKNQLQKKFQELLEEHKLAKMQIQLAEMAVKDALSYRESSISNRSDIMNRSDEIYTTKSHAQFMNGQLECFSNLDQSFNYQRRQVLANQLNHQDMVHFVSSPQLPLNDNEEIEFKLATTHEETTIHSPFKKKISKISEERRYHTEADQEKELILQQTNMKSGLKLHESIFNKTKKTVSLQCNLLKNVPKIRLFTKKQVQIPQATKKTKNESQIEHQAIKRKEKRSMTQSHKVTSKSAIMKSAASKIKINDVQSSSISRFFSFLSSKVITNRIKVK